MIQKPLISRIALSVRVSALALVAMVCCSVDAKAEDNFAGFPEFSWDRVPVCIHLSKENSDFNDQEASFIARFPLVCIEKTQGVRQYGGMEIGTLVAAKAIKAKNPKSTILLYMNSNIDHGSAYTTGLVLADDQHPEWALKDATGKYLEHNNSGKRIFDPSNPDMRRWWHSFITNILADDEIGGVFIDALPKYAAAPENKKKAWGEDKFNAVYSGLHTMLDSLHADLRSQDKIMIANYLRGNKAVMEDMGTHFLNHTDGAMMEHLAAFATADKESIANDIELIADAGRKGKIVVVKGWVQQGFGTGKTATQGPQEGAKPQTRGELKEGARPEGARPEGNRPPEGADKDRGERPRPTSSQADKELAAREAITFPLACFLAGAGKYAYFCYSWGYRDTDGGMVDYDEYNQPLGEPLGDAVRDGWIFTRSFEHADVWVDVENRKAEINWK